MNIHKSIYALLLLLGSTHAIAAPVSFSSGVEQNVLVELYTSEGCSSCPPAEELLNSFRGHEDLWKYYIPLAFHVDYWDYLGWRDPYASRLFSQRQRRHAEERNVRTVYTPAFIVNGRAWRSAWLGRYPKPDMRRTGVLKVDIEDDNLSAWFAPRQAIKQSLDLHIALLGMGLHTDIEAGENEGRRATHDFVVVGAKTVSADNGSWQTRLPGQHYKKRAAEAIAVWVSRKGSLKPLQATGGMLRQGL